MDGKQLAAFQQMQDRLRRAKPLALGSLSPSKTLAVSVDMNNGFAKKGALYSDRVNELIPKTQAFAAACAARGIELAALCDRHTAQSPELKGYPPHCMEGTDESLIVEELSGYFGKTIYKNSTNCFYRLQESGFVGKGFTTYIVTGCCTDICVFQLAVSLKTWFNETNTECSVVVPVALVETYDAPGHDAEIMNAAFLCSMMDNGIDVVSDILL